MLPRYVPPAAHWEGLDRYQSIRGSNKIRFLLVLHCYRVILRCDLASLPKCVQLQHRTATQYVGGERVWSSVFRGRWFCVESE
jgi:hypothetical protein